MPLGPLALAGLVAVVAVAAACRERHVVGEIDGAGGAGGHGPVSSCGTFVAGDDLRVCAASYLSGRGAEAAATVDFESDRTIVIAGSDDGVDFGKTPVSLLGGGTGTLVRLRADGHAVLSLTRIGQGLVDMEVDVATGRIAVAGPPFGVASLQPDGSAVVWTVLGAKPACVMGSNTIGRYSRCI